MLNDVKQTYWKLAAGCIGSALPLMIFGSGVMGIVLAIGIVLGLIATKGNSLRDTVSFIRTSKVVRVVGALFAVFLLSSALSVNVEHSMDKMLELAGMAILALGLYIALREMPTRHVELTYQSLAVSTIIVALLALLDALLGDVRLSSALHGVDSASSADRLVKMSGVFAVLTPFLWAWLLRMYKEGAVLAKWLGLPACVLSVLAVFVTGGFAGWLALIVSLVIFTAFAMKYHGLQTEFKGLFVTSITLVAGPVGYLYSQGLLFKPMFGLNVMFERFVSYFSGRLDTWQQALAHFGDNVFMGTGVNTFKLLPMGDSGETMAHPHNFLIQLLIETGLVGTAVTLLVMGLMVKYFWKASRTNLYGAAGLAAILSFMISALSHTSIFTPWWLTFLVFSGVFSARVGWAIVNKK